MRTTAILNLKGGVAKTVTAVNMAAILAEDYGKRVLVMDADSQCNTTEFFGGAPKDAPSFADMLRKNDVGQIVRATEIHNVWLLPADDSLMDLDLSSVKSRQTDVGCLDRFLRTSSQATGFDFVLIDCPPAFNAASAAALVAADDVVIPIKLDAFSLRGMANLMRQIRNMQKINPALRLAGLLPTMIYKSDSIKEALAALHQSSMNVYPPIRRSNKADDSTFAQEPLIWSSPKSAACIDYRRFVVAFLGREARRYGKI